MNAKLLSTLDAFRAILRAKYPEREDLLQINSYQWFHDRQQLPDGLFGEAIRLEEDRPAYESIEHAAGRRSQRSNWVARNIPH
jgi:hypothetical protein